MNHTDRAIQLKAELDSLRPLAPDVERKVLDKLRLDWNYHSNHLEGNQLDYGETKALLLHGITAQGKPLRDHLEIRGHNEAVLQLLDMARNNAPISQTDIRNLHKVILGEPYEVKAETPEGKPSKTQVIPGEYKTQRNHVRTATGAMLHFAEPFEVPSKMTVLMDWLEKQRGAASNPILVAATFHYEFVRIHPFDDGNGRMARLLMNLELMRAGFPPAVVRTEEKDAYFNALRQADGGDLTAFAEHIAERVERSLSKMLAAARGESIDEPNDLDKKLFLLEQTLRADKKLLEPTRTQESLQHLFDKSFAPLVMMAHNTLRKFDRFFDTASAHVAMDSAAPSGSIDQQLLLGREGLAPRDLTLAYFHSLWESKVGGVPNIRVTIEFRMNRNDYEVSCELEAAANSFTLDVGHHSYDELLSPTRFAAFLDDVTRVLLRVLGFEPSV
jgi:Fic family protein